MKARDIMTSGPACCTPDDTIERAAHLMEEHDCGCIPVVREGDEPTVVGVVTDRDIAVRAVGHGRGTDTHIRDVMTAAPSCCGPDSDLRDVERVMEDRQVRRVVITDDDGCCVGIVAQADLARCAEERRDLDDAEVGRVVERISHPSSRMDARL